MQLSGSSFHGLTSSLVDKVLSSSSVGEVLVNAAEGLGNSLRISRAMAVLLPVDGVRAAPPIEWTPDEPSEYQTASAQESEARLVRIAEFIEQIVPALPNGLLLDIIDESRLIEPILADLHALGVRSLAAVATRFQGRPNGSILLLQCHGERRWSEFDRSVIETVAYYTGIAIGHTISRLRSQPPQAARTIREDEWRRPVPELRQTEEPRRDTDDSRYRRLIEHIDAVIFHSDRDGNLTYVSRRGLDFFGITPEDLVSSTGVSWVDFVHPEDRQRLQGGDRRGIIEQMLESRSGCDEEFRIINRVTGKVRWILLRLVPILDRRETNSEVQGWDGFGVDISERREAQEALEVQSRRVRALYTVSSAMRGYLDPGGIASRGLMALCDATGADAGVCYLYGSRSTDKLTLVAHYGLSERFVANARSSTHLSALIRYVADQGQSIIVSDLRNDPRAGRAISDEEGLRSGALVPVFAEESRLGAIALFSRVLSRFDGGDVMLASAAANQIGLSARQANLFAAYRRQAKNLSAVYRMSHELSREETLADLFQQAFTIIRDELGLKRLWLGLLNDTGTRIVGQAAHGPGFKRRLVEINVDIHGWDHPIARVVRKKTPMLIDNPQQVLEQLGVRKVFSRMGIRSMALVPLLARGQVLGVLAVQPRNDDLSLDDEELTLLASLANEIAAILLARRLEDRVQQGEKMRTASHLAAGIAHNFNNLLQAILGQASLLEIQGKNDPGITRAVRVMTEAANRGAALVRQLLSIAHLEEPRPEPCGVNDLVERGYESLRKLLHDRQSLDLDLARRLPRVHADPRQIMRILSALVSNAVDSMPDGGFVRILTGSVVLDEHAVQMDALPGTYVRIAVSDTGIGMDEETQRRCFEPFFTTKDIDPSSGLSMTGAGLGLAAAYTMARRNGGWITVDSKPGQGSLFTLYLPVAADTATAAVAAPLRRPRIVGKGDGRAERVRTSDKRAAERQFTWRDELAHRIERVPLPERTAQDDETFRKVTEERVESGASLSETTNGGGAITGKRQSGEEYPE